ncbi:tRNA (adenosine(37)-N6)-threonylcarbamoyltransferase complex transferase subunit TsaD [Candidatus Saccharibacteria bacterium]|nr:tRNA (adenosine(37)-N6)-threonylcarbamoyltransferase complex transferase subunit TsaD [Candidatus Saccharibacteria bacterium]
MKILGIETSCDETAAAVVEDGVKILSNVVVSQIDIFAEYGGVIPEVAARSHLEAMMPVVNKALSDAGCTWGDIDAIAVTHAPGLLGSLLIGTLTARTLAILHDKPLYAVHHLKSHVYANWLSNAEETKPVFSSAGLEFSSTSYAGSRAEPPLRGEPVRPGRNIGVENSNQNFMLQKRQVLVSQTPQFPLIALVISGGHTQILYMPAHNQFEIIGTTRDDAVGECFDKVAKILGLPYPGGPSIAKAALEGNAEKYKLPHPKIESLDFSFSGLKTAVLRAVQKELGLPISHPSYDLKNHLSEKQVADFAASFQKTAVEILCEKLALALEQHPDAQSVVIAGGVSANKALREALTEAYFPTPSLSGDNGAMVAAAAYYEITSGVEPTDPYSLNIYPRISIEQ